MTGLTARAIRLYEELGLVKASRDRLGHRQFSEAAQARLGSLARMRQCGIALADMRHVFCGDGAAGRTVAIETLCRRLGKLEADRSLALVLLAELRMEEGVDQACPAGVTDRRGARR